MSNPNDPWSIRPDPRPTEVLGEGGGAGHTTDPRLAYGPLPNPTLAYPTYEGLRAQQAYGGLEKPEVFDAPEPPPRSTAMMVGFGIAGGLLLAALVGVGFLLIGHHGDSSSNVLNATTSAAPLPGPAPVPPPTRDHGPGFGSGGTIGAITANEGGTLSVRGLLGRDTDTVHTDARTMVVSLNGTKVSDLKVGDVVIVQGPRGADGSIKASFIISTSLK